MPDAVPSGPRGRAGRLLAGLCLETAAAAAALALAIELCGYSPIAVFLSVVDGAFGSFQAVSVSLLKTAPLLWTGLGVTVAFRAGMWNIGAEGQFYAGALAAAWAGIRLAGLPALPLVAFAASLLAGGLWGLAAAVLRVVWGVSEVLGTIMLNFIALELVSYAVHGPLQEAARSYPQSDRISPAACFGRVTAGSRVHWGVPLAVLAALALWLFLDGTKAGFRLRAVGLNPEASRVAGVSPERSWLLALTLSGALAGAGGAGEILGVTNRLYERFSAGYGYTAIAVALLGRLHPALVLASALFFGALEAGSGTMQRVAGIPSVLVTLLQGMILALIVARQAKFAGPSTARGAMT